MAGLAVLQGRAWARWRCSTRSTAAGLRAPPWGHLAAYMAFRPQLSGIYCRRLGCLSYKSCNNGATRQSTRHGSVLDCCRSHEHTTLWTWCRRPRGSVICRRWVGRQAVPQHSGVLPTTKAVSNSGCTLFYKFIMWLEIANMRLVSKINSQYRN